MAQVPIPNNTSNLQHQQLARANTSTHSAPFRFTSLPLELRESIYTHALPPSHDLHTLRMPSILKTTRQLHREALPLFFKENAFDAYIGSCFYRKKRNETLPAPIDPIQAGGLLLPEWIETFGKGRIVVRHVTFWLYHPHDLPKVWAGGREREGLLLAKVTFGVVMRGSCAEVSHEEDYCQQWKAEYTTEDAKELFDPAMMLADEMASRPGFHGFTIEDLRRLAAALGERAERG